MPPPRSRSVKRKADCPSAGRRRGALGPYRRNLLPLYLKWINDFEVTRTLGHGCRPMTLEAEALGTIAPPTPNACLASSSTSALRPIGGANLDDIDHRHRTAEIGLFIGEKECWGQGCGTEATILLLDYGFSALGLHNIMLRVFSHNERAIRAYTRAGFRTIGRRREAHCVDGQIADDICLRHN